MSALTELPRFLRIRAAESTSGYDGHLWRVDTAKFFHEAADALDVAKQREQELQAQVFVLEDLDKRNTAELAKAMADNSKLQSDVRELCDGINDVVRQLRNEGTDTGNSSFLYYATLMLDLVAKHSAKVNAPEPKPSVL